MMQDDPVQRRIDMLNEEIQEARENGHEDVAEELIAQREEIYSDNC